MTLCTEVPLVSVSVPGGRAERSDKGEFRLNGRDFAALAWLADMRAISEPDLGVLLGQLAGKGPVTVHSAKSVVRRWMKLGLADVKKVLAKEPRVITLTKKGSELVGEERWTELAWTSLPHFTAVSRARLWLELSPPNPGWRVEGWESELAYRRRYDQAVKAGLHVPDGVLITSARRVAIEVERRAKTVERTTTIVSDLRKDPDFQGVIYVVAQDVMGLQGDRDANQAGQVARTVRAAVEKSLAEIPESDKTGVKVLALPNDLIATLREKEDTAGQ